MGGFFTKKEMESSSRPDGKTYSCVSCTLHKSCNSPKMKAFGNFKKGILNIGEAPGDMEDRAGKQWQGKAGKLLEQTYKKLGIDLFEDCLNINAVNCQPLHNRPPSNYEIECCRKHVLQLIKEKEPKVIVVFGNAAIYSLLGHRWKKDLGGIVKWRGWTIPDQDFKAWVCPVFHPSYVNKEDSTEATTIWVRDLTKAVSLIKTPIPIYEEPEIEYISDLSPLVKNIPNGSVVAFDYETTGLKPHADEHRIVCASVATGPDHVYAFLMPSMRKDRKPFTDLLANPLIGKMAHNIKFEESWSVERLVQPIENWDWDSMQAAHVLDNRPGITSLKFQTYVNFGVVDYASEITPYLHSSDFKNGNGINQIQTLLALPGGKEKLLRYCALDSVFEYKLAMKQKSEILLPFVDPKVNNLRSEEAYRLMHDGILALGRAEQQGIRVDTDYITAKKEQLTKRIDKLEKEFKKTTFYKHWEHSMGGKSLNINSGTQLRHFLYNVKKIDASKFTASGEGSTDIEALDSLNIPELKFFSERNRFKKAMDVLEGFEREQVRGYVHPFFNLHTARTYRSSSDHPNFQNIPKRDEEVMQICRQALYPRPGHQFIEVDYSGLEVKIAACYHKDPTMLKYINNPASDMHADMAKQIFLLDKFDKSVHKVLRQAAKNGFVFPEFYGDYYKNCASIMACKWGGLPQGRWKPGQGIMVGDVHLSDHFAEHGIKSLISFESHLQKIETDFWENRFSDYASWKDRWWTVYKKYGYVDLYTGFRCSGVMGKNDVINYPVQGAAFHCLMWSFIEVDRLIHKYGMNTRIVGQIHDAIVLDVDPKELSRVIRVIRRVTCEDLPEAWKWIIVPLDVEVEICGVDKSWAEKQKMIIE